MRAIRKNMYRRSTHDGFTLAEVLVAMALGIIVITVAHSLYTFQHKTFRVQEQVAEAQQNARAALQMLSRDVVMAGYSTSLSGVAFANATSLTVRVDKKEISFRRYSGARMGRVAGGPSQPIAENIRSLQFVYIDSGGNPIAYNLDGYIVNPLAIRQIGVSVTATTPVFGEYSSRCTLSTFIAPRNL